MDHDVGSRGMREVDKQEDPRHIISHLDSARASKSIQLLKQTSYAMLRAEPGHHLLDVGCGTGEDVQALAALSGPTGRAVGVDVSETLIVEAKKRAETLGAAIDFQTGDIYTLDFDDASFDGLRAERVFQHLEDPLGALNELVRVARLGGRVVVADPDWETWTVNFADKQVTRKILNHGVDSYVRNGWIGRQLFGLFNKAGLREVEVTALTDVETSYERALSDLRLETHADRAQEAGIVTAADAKRWLGDLAEAGRVKAFFCSVTMFIVGGTKA